MSRKIDGEVFFAGFRNTLVGTGIKAAIVICQQIILLFAPVIFLFKFPLEDPVVELQFLTPLRVVLLCVRSSAAICDILARTPIVFCSSACADRIVRAASRLRGAAAAP